MAKIMRVGRPQEEIAPEYGNKFTLKELQKMVNGYIYVISLGHGKGLVVDEDGELKGLPKNDEASKVLQEAYPTRITVDIVGTAVLVTRKEFTW